MMLTIAECYETGVYFIGDYICRNLEKEYQIWRKYNFQIIKFALQAIQQGSLCGRFFIYFFNDLMEFKDPRVVKESKDRRLSMIGEFVGIPKDAILDYSLSDSFRLILMNNVQYAFL